MKTPIFGLRAGILTQLIFLIVAAMLLINVVILNLYERDLIKAKEQSGNALVLSIENTLRFILQDSASNLKDIQSNHDFNAVVSDLLKASEFSGLAIIDYSGETVFKSGFSGERKHYALIMAISAMTTSTWSVNYMGTTWGVLWPGKSELCLSAPLRYKGRVIGGVSIITSLVPVYETLRKSEKLIALYVILDTIILALVGIYLLSRIVVGPIHKLLRMTEEYEDSEFISYSGDTSANEIGNLSRALASMLKRLDENKKELKNHIISLEKANNDLKSAQNEIIKSEKLASVGRLAAGIAHEIGNPIGIILGYIDLIQKGGLSLEEEKDFLARVESEITRINVIIRQLLDFSRSSTEQIEECSVHDLINHTVEMLKPQVRMRELEIVKELRAERDTVMADKNQLQQVFLNILINSIDAMEEQEHLDEKSHIMVSSKNKTGSIILDFTDTGPGVSAEDLGRIFDPFFTTKEPGRGTGLGLSVCYRIIEGLGGTIKAESAPEGGMTINIGLPLDEDPDEMS